MRKRVLRVLSLIFIPLLAVTLTASAYGQYLDKRLEENYTAGIGKVYGVKETNKGTAIVENAAKNDDIIVIGSSELAANVPQNIQHLFPNTDLEKNICLVGKPYIQDLLNIVRLGSMSEELKGKKIVLLVSLQWFLEKDFQKDSYLSYFSELQFYRTMENAEISAEVKNYICRRSSPFIQNKEQFIMPYFYAQLYSENSVLSKAALAVLQPYYFVKEKFLTLKDKHQAYRAMLRHKSEFSSEVQEIDWEKELLLAEEMGKEACSNDFYIRDDYYTRYVENSLDYLRGLYSNIELLQSNEMKDYEMLMQLCHETGIDPYIIFIPTNGYFYDYTGLTADKRYELYDRLVEIAGTYGFSYFDMRNREYEPYILFDWIHLGWKGWVYVSEQISYYFGQNRQ